ncbi:MAG: phosphatase PAP2 family protein [Bacteroidota bacterium]
MIDVLVSIDKSMFRTLNQSVQNSLFDIVMPFLTNLDQQRPWIYLFVGMIWIGLVWKGGRQGRIVAFLLVPLIVLSDQLSSHLVKPLIGRARPCHITDGLPQVEYLRLLVDCGPGRSFPSSHAVNSFAAAGLFSYYYQKWFWAFLSFASVVAYSRVYVGVHYPFDALAGAAIGSGCAAVVILGWRKLEGWMQTRQEPRETESDRLD